MKLSAEQIAEILDLPRHSTCGFARESFQSTHALAPGALPNEYGGPRKLGDALYFLVTSEAPVRLHRIRSDQMYHHYFGDPLEVLLLYQDGQNEVRMIGSDLTTGQRPQLFIPGGTFHAAQVLASEFALLGTSVWIRAEPEDVEQGDVNKLMAAYPAAKDDILRFAN